MNKSKIIVAMMLVFIIATTSIAFVACNPKNNTKESVLMVGTTTVVDSLNRLDAAGGHAGKELQLPLLLLVDIDACIQSLLDLVLSRCNDPIDNFPVTEQAPPAVLRREIILEEAADKLAYRARTDCQVRLVVVIRLILAPRCADASIPP